MEKKQLIKLGDTVSIAFETNGRGYMGFIVELPGAFIRGKTENEAISKVDREVNIYLKWLCIEQKLHYKIQVVQKHQSILQVEDADNKILLDEDKKTMDEKELRNLLNLVCFSGEIFLQLYSNVEFKDWIDEARIRKTFYGDNPKTIREIFEHVKNCQYYYLSRMRINEEIDGDFMAIRKFCLEKLETLYRESNNSLKFEIDNELWTLKKVLRRFIWHDRIHGKAMVRILEKQKQLRIIDKYEDPFHFMEATLPNSG